MHQKIKLLGLFLICISQTVFANNTVIIKLINNSDNDLVFERTEVFSGLSLEIDKKIIKIHGF